MNEVKKSKLIDCSLLLVIIIVFVAVFYLVSDSEHEHIELNDSKIENSRAKQDSLKMKIIASDSVIKKQTLLLDSMYKNHEKIKTKPKPQHLRNATIAELDSFWATYKAHQ